VIKVFDGEIFIAQSEEIHIDSDAMDFSIDLEIKD
jgi:hypothetical protein